MKAIFLDIDGVMIPKLFSKFLEQMSLLTKGDVRTGDVHGEYFHPDCIVNLKLLQEYSESIVILTTNWKKDRSLVQLQFLLNIRCDLLIKGITPIIDPSVGCRGEEIDQFIYENGHLNIDKYVIIDDMGPRHFLSHQHDKLVTCNENYGFTKKELKEAMKILE